MNKNFNDKYKAYMDELVRSKLGSSRENPYKEEAVRNKLDTLKKFACTLDMEKKATDKA
ncbi:MAG: hypothetical protein ACOZCL_16300 [Bacillota bacterium]